MNRYDLDIIRYCVSGNTFFICIFITTFSMKFDVIMFFLFMAAWIFSEVMEFLALRKKKKEDFYNA